MHTGPTSARGLVVLMSFFVIIMSVILYILAYSGELNSYMKLVFLLCSTSELNCSVFFSIELFLIVIKTCYLLRVWRYCSYFQLHYSHHFVFLNYIMLL